MSCAILALPPPEPKPLTASGNPGAPKFKFTKKQVANHIRQIKQLFEEGLLTDQFTTRKILEAEREAALEIAEPLDLGSVRNGKG